MMPCGSKKRAKAKRPKGAEVQQFDPPDVPIVFTDKRAPSSRQQTLRLLDFWRLAEEQGLAVFTEAFNCLALGGLGAAASNLKLQDARFWCPKIESLASVSPDMHHMVLASVAEAILPYRLNVYVDDMLKACYRDYIEDLEVEKERKISTLRSLLLEEETQKPGDPSSLLLEEETQKPGDPSRVEDTATGVSPPNVEDNVLSHVQSDFEVGPKDNVLPGSGVGSEDNVLPGFAFQPLGPQFVPSSSSKTYGKLDGWKIKYHGKQMGFDDALVDLLDSSKKQQETLSQQQETLSQQHAMLITLFVKMSSTEQQVSKQLQTLEKALSNTSERAARSSFSLFYTHLCGPCVVYPVFSAVMPYRAIKVLEDLAALCIPAEGTRATPSEVEVDTLMRIRKPSADSFLAGSSSSGDSFTHLVIGETTRSLGLCCSHADYVHPSKPQRTKSSKLLYKFIQLERGLIVALQLHGWTKDSLDGACLVSPSFKALSSPELLLDTVLNHCKGTLRLLYKLHQNKSVWLFDI